MSEREFIKQFVEKEIIGPSNDLLADDGQELLLYDRPTARYISGILYPQNENVDTIQTDIDVGDEDLLDQEGEEVADIETLPVDNNSLSYEDTEEWLNLSNAYKQSALSITVCTNENETFDIIVNAAVYFKEKNEKAIGSMGGFAFHRKPINIEIKSFEYGPPSNKPYTKKLSFEDKPINLEIHIFFRYSQGDRKVYTITLENSNIGDKTNDDTQSFFQVELLLRSKTHFFELPELFKNNRDEDYLLNRLLYRETKKYAVGHGCSPKWDEKAETVTEISSDFMPSFENQSIMPTYYPNIDLSMLNMSEKGHKNRLEILETLDGLVLEYTKWISQVESKISALGDKDFVDIAAKNMKLCSECRDRMSYGISILRKNDKAFKAFQYMNEAMLLQQLHSSIEKRTWLVDEKKLTALSVPLPDIINKSTWGNVKGVWRPFQIAFILMNIRSIVEVESEERENVELIWFPTGGGKTEAYLGLSSFIIFLRRLLNPLDKGTDVIMRYTLRLLTAQQYERAATMICACDFLRSQNQSLLGQNEISIGLWVGGDSTPNKRKEAIEARKKMYSGENTKNNPFVILKCPWCGAEMGILSHTHGKSPKKDFIRGYKRDKLTETVFFQCDNPDCHFSEQGGYRLPLYVIDEDIYEKPPSLIIGTVDKFAMLPFLPQANSIFGLDKNGTRIKIPSLIIQDELHLISGPLGSTVSLYETMIDYLTTDFSNKDKPIRPKIIASTATISRAKEQCRNLYCRPEKRIKIFPPSGIDAGESFFAHVKKTSDVPGRLYVGLYMPGSSSQATASIHVLSSIIQASKRIPSQLIDPYWTNVVYFNALKELGQAETWINADITEYSKTINKRIADGNDRYINRYSELTSRISGHRIAESLDELKISYGDQSKTAIDICLATNMISVGLDVSRLGLMTVMGQPKTASEYIQATSRVGRNPENPGIIFTIYSPSKPRDKSIFENFQNFHSKMYTYVEPTSVTPFSPQLRDRALAAVFFGMARLKGPEKHFELPQLVIKDEAMILNITNAIVDRVAFVDIAEKDNTRKQIIGIIKNWQMQNPLKYSFPFSRKNDYSGCLEIPCFYPNSLIVDDDWKIRSNSIPTSMRSVDKECCIKIVRREEDL